MTVSRLQHLIDLSLSALGIRPEYQERFETEVYSIARTLPDLNTISALTLAVFRLFVDTDTKKIISDEEIAEVALYTLMNREQTPQP